MSVTMEHVSEVAVTAKQPEIPGQSISKVHLANPEKCKHCVPEETRSGDLCHATGRVYTDQGMHNWKISVAQYLLCFP